VTAVSNDEHTGGLIGLTNRPAVMTAARGSRGTVGTRYGAVISDRREWRAAKRAGASEPHGGGGRMRSPEEMAS
jgi:hypothetical protein